VRPLGVEHFGQTGTLADLYGHYGIDTNAIIAAAQAITPAHQYATLKQFDRLLSPTKGGWPAAPICDAGNPTRSKVERTCHIDVPTRPR
jgi:hypothetical protein